MTETLTETTLSGGTSTWNIGGKREQDIYQGPKVKNVCETPREI